MHLQFCFSLTISPKLGIIELIAQCRKEHRHANDFYRCRIERKLSDFTAVTGTAVNRKRLSTSSHGQSFQDSQQRHSGRHCQSGESHCHFRTVEKSGENQSEVIRNLSKIIRRFKTVSFSGKRSLKNPINGGSYGIRNSANSHSIYLLSL